MQNLPNELKVIYRQQRQSSKRMANIATGMVRRKDRWATLRINPPNDDFGLITPWPETIPHLNHAVRWLKRISTFLGVQVVWSTKFHRKHLIGLSKDGILIKPMICALISFIKKSRKKKNSLYYWIWNKWHEKMKWDKQDRNVSERQEKRLGSKSIHHIWLYFMNCCSCWVTGEALPHPWAHRRLRLASVAVIDGGERRRHPSHPESKAGFAVLASSHRWLYQRDLESILKLHTSVCGPTYIHIHTYMTRTSVIFHTNTIHRRLNRGLCRKYTPTYYILNA